MLGMYIVGLSHCEGNMERRLWRVFAVVFRLLRCHEKARFKGYLWFITAFIVFAFISVGFNTLGLVLNVSTDYENPSPDITTCFFRLKSKTKSYSKIHKSNKGVFGFFFFTQLFDYLLRLVIFD